MLRQIMAFGQSREQRDVLLLAGSPPWAPRSPRRCGSYMEANGSSPVCNLPRRSPRLRKRRARVDANARANRSTTRSATVAEEMKRYKKEMTSFNSLGREKAKAEEPEMPLNRMFIFSGNNTGTGILQNIIDSGGVGIICETEADMVSNSIASDYGHWSEVIRSSFDHDPLSYNRRTDREYRELSHSHLSVLISGTPGQVKPLIPSSENGLFSRQMFYYMPRVLHWINQFSLQRTDTSLEFQKLGKDWIAHLREIQKLGVISLRLTDAQIVSFNEVFQTLFERSRNGTGNEMNSSVVRMAINIGRIPVDRRPIANNRGMRGGGRLRRQPAQSRPAHARLADLRRQHQGRDHHPLGSLHPRG